MIKYFPPKDQDYTYLQTNRSDDLGSLWSTFNLDFQTNLGTMRLAQKLVTNTTSSDDADLGLPCSFDTWYGKWWAICGTRIFKNTGDPTTSFTEDTGAFGIGGSTTRFDISNPGGTTFRYTFDGTGTDPGITALTFPVGAVVYIKGTNFAAGNETSTGFTVTNSGANFFEVTNAAGVVEVDKTIGSGFISVSGGTYGRNFSPLGSDSEIFEDELWVTTTGALYSKTIDEPLNPADSSWFVRDGSLESTSIHPMTYFKKFNRLYYVSSTSNIRSIDEDYLVATSGDYTLNPGRSIGYISSIVSTTQFIWYGSYRANDAQSATRNNTMGSIGQWDGISAQPTAEYTLPTAGCIALTVLEDIPYALDTSGRILKFTGASFVEIARLPINRTLLTKSTTYVVGTNKFAHFNGFVATKNNTLMVLINNLNEDANSTINENLPSGIWELDLATGNFTHRYSPTLKARSSSTITDYGQNRIVAAGALKINTLESTSTNGQVSLLAGFSYYTDASSTKSGIFIDSPANPNTDNEGQKRGYFVTTWFNSDEIQDKWTRLWATFRRFLNSTDKIIFKYRLNEEDPTYATITWTSTTTFTTTTNISAYGPTASGFNGTIGGEVEVIQGTGSGSCTHITNVQESGGTYTVTIDNAVTGVSGTAKARFQKWIKILPEVTGQVLSYASMSITDASNVRIQIKGVLEWTGDDEFYKMAIWPNEDIKISA